MKILTGMFTITAEPINTEHHRKSFVDESCGALVSFEGIVRNHHEGKSVTSLSYEHHPVMAQPEGEKILTQSLKSFPIHSAMAIHRIGNVPIGEVAVIVLVASSHRREAFEACQHIIDEIKRKVPLWKFETYADGTSLYTDLCKGCAH